MSEPEIKFSKEVNEVGEKIEKWNIGLISELIEWIKTRFNIKEQAVIQAANTTQTSEKVEEKTSNVSIKLIDIGSQKVPIYTLIRATHKELKGAEINLMEAKKLTESEGKVIFENIPKAKAEEVKKKLEEVGAKAKIE